MNDYPQRPREGAKAVTWDWQLLNDIYTDDARCYSLTDRQVGFLLSVFRVAYWFTRWFNRPADKSDITAFVAAVETALLLPILCPTSTIPTNIVQRTKQLPDCITVNGDIIDICLSEDCDMTINIYQGCGCGCGDSNTASFGGGSSSGGGASGSWMSEPQPVVSYSGTLSDCEMLTGGILDYIIDQMQELLEGLAGANGAITTILDFLATFNPIGVITSDGVDWLTDQSVELFSNAYTLWDDVDFRDDVHRSWALEYQDVTSWSSITRAQVIALGDNLQQIRYIGSYPVATRTLWKALARFINMSKVNSRLVTAKDNCDQSAYIYYKALAGVPYTAPADPTTVDKPFPTEDELLAAGFAWAHVYDLRIAPFEDNTSFDWYSEQGVIEGEWIEGEGLVGVCDVPAPPHSTMSLDFKVNHSGVAGSLTYIATEYQYTPQSTGAVVHLAGNTNYDVATGWDNVRYATVLINSGSVRWTLVPKVTYNSATTCGTKPAVKRIALAGTGSDPFVNLVQVGV